LPTITILTTRIPQPVRLIIQTINIIKWNRLRGARGQLINIGDVDMDSKVKVPAPGGTAAVASPAEGRVHDTTAGGGGGIKRRQHDLFNNQETQTKAKGKLEVGHPNKTNAFKDALRRLVWEGEGQEWPTDLDKTEGIIVKKIRLTDNPEESTEDEQVNQSRQALALFLTNLIL